MNEFLVVVGFGFLSLVWAELREWLPHAARKVVEKAVLSLPATSRERMSEELLAELNAIPGKISPLFFAVSLWWGISRSALLTRFEKSLSSFIVRALDILIAAVSIVMAAPTILVVLFAGRLANKRGALYQHRAVGLKGRPFSAFVFGCWNGRQQTSLGRFLHRTGLSRLAQLFNVLKGDMSIVGPPLSPSSWHANSLATSRLKPGLCWGACASGRYVGLYGRSPFETSRLYFKWMIGAIVQVLLEDAVAR